MSHATSAVPVSKKNVPDHLFNRDVSKTHKSATAAALVDTQRLEHT